MAAGLKVILCIQVIERWDKAGAVCDLWDDEWLGVDQTGAPPTGPPGLYLPGARPGKPPIYNACKNILDVFIFVLQYQIY